MDWCSLSSLSHSSSDGYIVRTLLNEKQTLVDEISGLQLEIPATWNLALEEDTAVDLAAIDPRADSAYKTRLSLYSRLLDPNNPVGLSSVVDRLVENYTENLTSFQLLALDNRTIQGADTAVLEYAYAVNSNRRALPRILASGCAYPGICDLYADPILGLNLECR